MTCTKNKIIFSQEMINGKILKNMHSKFILYLAYSKTWIPSKQNNPAVVHGGLPSSEEWGRYRCQQLARSAGYFSGVPVILRVGSDIKLAGCSALLPDIWLVRYWFWYPTEYRLPNEKKQISGPSLNSMDYYIDFQLNE